MISRKLVTALAALAAGTGLVLGLAAIDQRVFADAKDVVIIALGGIFGLGGWNVLRQAQVDAAAGVEAGGVASRKLAAVCASMGAAAGLVLGIAAIDPAIFDQAKEIIILALGGIFGIGGWQVQQQAVVDVAVAAARNSPSRFYVKDAPGAEGPFNQP